MKALLLALFEVLTAPDPAQMEKAADLGYGPEEAALPPPAGITMGAPSSVAITATGHLLVFNRGSHPFIELDASGRFMRVFGEGMYTRPHGMRIDVQGHIWTTDVAAQVSGFAGQIFRLDANGRTLAATGQPGEALGEFGEAHYLTIAPGGDIYSPNRPGRRSTSS